jgi:protein phosphatase
MMVATLKGKPSMLLTITTTYQPATDLGYLLHKRPDRVQTFELAFGQAHVFYPDTTGERCTATLLLDRYCWAVNSINDLKLAPFHLLASEGAVHADQNHLWHIEHLAKLCAADPELLQATSYQVVNLTDADSQAAGVQWWQDMTERGGEGMVVKPLDFIAVGRRGVLQPAIKVRGREYLRIIYGPEYTAPEQLELLRSRGLKAKRSLALREFALGIEALERFVRQEPLRRIHECTFGVLALESEPVDPRL